MVSLILAAVSSSLANAWEDFCGDLAFVSIYRGSILDLRCDAVVSPANSFGFMDGGIDARYSDRFGWQVQKRLQETIRRRHHGELLVGTAEIVETDAVPIPYLIAAPTMRVPTILPPTTVNPYLAARAVLLLVKKGIFAEGILQGERLADAIETIAFPGLGTGIGRVDPQICARQMRRAIDDILLEKFVFPDSFTDAQRQHQQLYGDRDRDLQIDP